MKSLFRFLLAGALLLSALKPAHAQAVANGGFETWAIRNGVDSPTTWLTTDDIVQASFGLSFPTGTYTKTTDAHGGTYAARLETRATLLGALPGAIGIGTRVGPNINVPGGTPFTARPATLQFYYKLSGAQPTVASNGAFVQVALTRTVGGVSQSIATAQQVFTTVTSSYMLAQVPLVYTSSTTPDSVRIVFSSGAIPSATGATPTAGTVFQIDDISFTGTATASRAAELSATLTIYPNPSSNGRYLLAASPALLAAPLTVTDATGRVVRTENSPSRISATRLLDLNGLPGGVYTLQLMTAEGLIMKKLVVQ